MRFFDALESWRVGTLVRWFIEELLRTYATGSQRQFSKTVGIMGVGIMGIEDCKISLNNKLINHNFR